MGVLRLIDCNNYNKKQVILVDHNNYEQSINGLNEAEIIEVVDHHNIGNIGTNAPIYFTCRPVGCTGTIIYDRYKKENVSLPKDMAGLILSAIISDTLLLTSPITTDIDRTFANELADYLDINLETYGLEMLKAGSSIKGLSIDELLNQDFKSYSINNQTYGVAVITTMEFDEIAKNIDDYIAKLDELANSDYAAVFIFSIDIIKQGSFILYNKASESLIANMYNLKEIHQGMFLPGIISRKKQIIPALMKELEK